MEDKILVEQNVETGRWDLRIGNYRISSDSYQWVLFEVKKKQEGEGEYFNTLGYFSSMKSVFYALREHKLSKVEITSINQLLQALTKETIQLNSHVDNLVKMLKEM